MATPDRGVLATLLVVALVVVSGAVVMLGTDDAGEGPQNATAIQRTVDDRVSNVESYRATMVQRVSYGNTTQRFRLRVGYELGRYNLTYTEMPDDRHPVVVANETTQWYYDPAAEVVRRRPRNQSRTTNLFARFTDSLFEDENITYEGTETLSGTETVRLSYSQYNQTISLALGGTQASQLTVPDSEYGNATTRIWVDAERRIPVRVRTTATYQGERITRTIRFEDVALGVDVADDRFDAPPVADVPVVTEQRPTVTHYDSRATLRANTTGPLPAASVPSSFEYRTGVRVQEPNGTTVSLVYTDGVSQLVISRTDPAVPDEEISPNMTLAGHPAEFETEYGHGRVHWECGDYRYRVSAALDVPLSKEQIVDVAASVGCPS